MFTGQTMFMAPKAVIGEKRLALTDRPVLWNVTRNFTAKTAKYTQNNRD